ncbi:hypothetical protein [Geobacillus stearothermophilus]|uniref:hypothetical protein n=1 Tax=Geobacillus stearothermophilus TaxID=1422 RepID=UPI0024027105|nr:hypothetical protein [Geobacillus stearothermophilus]MDF9297697.1 hypothetical protein [Geobacillus stearothermophilus]
MRKRWVSLAAIGALAISLCAGCGGQDEERPEKRNQSSNMGGGMNTSGTGRQTPLFATASIIY